MKPRFTSHGKQTPLTAKEGQLAEKQAARSQPAQIGKRQSGGFFPPSRFPLPLPPGRAFSCISILALFLLFFLVLVWLPSPAPLLLGEIKVKPKATPREEMTAAASSPSSCPRHGRWPRSPGTLPAMVRALISNLIASFCQPLHNTNSSAPIYHRKEVGDGRKKSRRNTFLSHNK